MRRPLVEVEKAKYLDCVSESAADQDLKAPGERRQGIYLNTEVGIDCQGAFFSWVITNMGLAHRHTFGFVFLILTV